MKDTLQKIVDSFEEANSDAWLEDEGYFNVSDLIMNSSGNYDDVFFDGDSYGRYCLAKELLKDM